MSVCTRFIEWACLEAPTMGSTQPEEEDPMRSHLFIQRVVLLSFLISISFLATPATYAADQLVEGAIVLAPIGALNVVASGAVEDTLKACLARIPEDASAGQRLLAEQSCAGEEGTRALIQVAPKF
jgi:hypothetical protein